MNTGLGRFLKMSAATLLAVMFSAAAVAGTATEQRVTKAIDVLHDFTAIPEQGIPKNLLANAHAVAIVPGVIKAGFGIGGRYGKGVLMVRQPDGAWSNPTFITLGGGSFGWQIGAQSTDLMLVFKDARSVQDIAEGKLTLGGDASVAAGPVGRSTSAATDQRLEAEIYSYSRNRGLFAGIALDGAWIGMDSKANDQYYGNGLSPVQILDARNIPAPLSAQQLVNMVASTAPRIDLTPLAREAAATLPAAGSPQSDDAEVRTYAIDPAVTGGDETVF